MEEQEEQIYYEPESEDPYASVDKSRPCNQRSIDTCYLPCEFNNATNECMNPKPFSGNRTAFRGKHNFSLPPRGANTERAIKNAQNAAAAFADDEELGGGSRKRRSRKTKAKAKRSGSKRKTRKATRKSGSKAKRSRAKRSKAKRS